MADQNQKLDAIVQINGTEYEVTAKSAEIAANAEKLGGRAADDYALKDDLVAETKLTIVNKTQSDTADSVYAVTNLAEDPNNQNGHYVTPTYTPVPTKKYVDDNKQAKLVSGTNIKTINGESLLGSGNISITGGGIATIPELIIKKNGTTVATYNANSTSPVNADISVPTITDNLTSTSTTAALSANQGRLLKEAISGFKNITVSQTEPTGGATGDIWFKY